MQYVRDSARIEAFKVAQQNKNPEECNFIKRFDEGLDWKYFDLDNADNIMGKSVISLPFNKDFDKISALEKL
jgi:hypothetical protein